MHDWPAMELVRQVRARTVSRREVLRAHLDRIDELDGSVGAFVERRDREQALAEADAADRAHDERASLPLDGVPVSIKDHFDVEGMRHTEGVAALAERRSPRNAAAVQRLVDAGAFVVGKCNQPDFQIRWNTVNALYPPTRNPRDLSRTAGGSSGGDAASVAAGMSALGLGADYGGSIRVPASFCGVFGLRPSAGRVPHPLDVEVVFDRDRHSVERQPRAFRVIAIRRVGFGSRLFALAALDERADLAVDRVDPVEVRLDELSPADRAGPHLLHHLCRGPLVHQLIRSTGLITRPLSASATASSMRSKA